MRTKGKVSRAREVMTVVRHFEPDMARQVRALLLVLGSASPDKFEEDQGEGATDSSDCPQLRLARGGRGSNRRRVHVVSSKGEHNDSVYWASSSSEVE
jgi:hypothetical protein